MISVLMPCYSRQQQLDITLPLLLKQTGVELQVVLGVGPSITHQSDPRIKIVPISKAEGLSTWFNQLIAAADGDIIMYLYNDIALKDPTSIKQMADKCIDDRTLVTLNFHAGPQIFNMGYCQCIMMTAKLVKEAGGWDPIYDNYPAWEDAEALTRMSMLGATYEQVFIHGDLEAEHIEHPCVRSTSGFLEGYCRNKKIYNRRWGKNSIMEGLNAGIVNGKRIIP